MRADVSHCFHSASTWVRWLRADGRRVIRLREQLSRQKTVSVLPETVSVLPETVSVLFWVQLSRLWLQLIRQRDSCSHKKAVRLSKKWYDFFTATAVSHSGTANTATATAIPCAGTAISRTYLICERVVKRSWNVWDVPAPPHPLYLLGFRQIRERWNLFFENQFSLLAQRMASRENKL